MRVTLSDKRVRLQLVIRWKPRLTVYPRSEPVTIRRPTRAQAHCRSRFGELSGVGRFFSAREVAEMLGGEVIKVNGREAVKLPDGRILQKHQAFLKAMLTGFKSPYTRVHLPKWLRELSRTYYTIPGYLFKKYKVVAEKLYIGGRK